MNMKTEDIIRDIHHLDIYTQEQFTEYLGYFRQKNELLGYLRWPESSRNEIDRRIRSNAGANPVNPGYLSETVTSAHLFVERQRGSAVLGVVSGCFDLLHLGHIRSMAYAKQFLSQYTNPLLAALTLSDENIRAKKGNNRPVLELNERLGMICSVECVDYVIPLEQSNCLTVLDELKPDYFFKTGTDRVQGIVRQEMELVESYGGKVEVFPSSLFSGIKSTTEIIGSVLERIMKEQ